MITLEEFLELDITPYEVYRNSGKYKHLMDENGNINCEECENCFYCISCSNCKDCDLCYNCYNAVGCVACSDSQDITNCTTCLCCFNCEDCFSSRHCIRVRGYKYTVGAGMEIEEVEDELLKEFEKDFWSFPSI